MLTKRHLPIVVGIDLAGSAQRNTGVCKLRGKTVTGCKTLHGNEEIVHRAKKAHETTRRMRSKLQ